MNFLQRIATGRLFYKKSEPRYKPANVPANVETNEQVNVPVNVAVNEPDGIPDLVAKFTFMEETYILENFEIGFSQEVNEKGKPGGLPHGGIMTLTLSETPDANINAWITREDLLRDGEIRFFPNKEKIKKSSILDITFKDAYCIRYKKQIDALGWGLRTTLVVSPRYIKIGIEEFENNWKKEESLPYYIRSN